MLKTLAGKHRSTVTKMSRKCKSTIETSDGPRLLHPGQLPRDEGKKPLTARFGGISLKRQRAAVLTGIRPVMAA